MNELRLNIKKNIPIGNLDFFFQVHFSQKRTTALRTPQKFMYKALKDLYFLVMFLMVELISVKTELEFHFDLLKMKLGFYFFIY